MRLPRTAAAGILLFRVSRGELWRLGRRPRGEGGAGPGGGGAFVGDVWPSLLAAWAVRGAVVRGHGVGGAPSASDTRSEDSDCVSLRSHPVLPGWLGRVLCREKSSASCGGRVVGDVSDAALLLGGVDEVWPLPALLPCARVKTLVPC